MNRSPLVNNSGRYGNSSNTFGGTSLVQRSPMGGRGVQDSSKSPFGQNNSDRTNPTFKPFGNTGASMGGTKSPFKKSSAYTSSKFVTNENKFGSSSGSVSFGRPDNQNCFVSSGTRSPFEK